MSQVIEEVKAEYNRAKERLKKNLHATPADKQNWSPSPNARTPIQLVGHAANGTKGIGGMLQGQPMPFSSIQEMDAAMRAEEKSYTSAQQVIDILEAHSAAYFAWLDTLTDEQIAGTVNLPFGPAPMSAAITFPADHLRGHASQLEYLQTCYGDYDWRF